MAFIEMVAAEDADGLLRKIYDGDLETFGFVPNHGRIISLRPEVLATWRAFQASIKKNLRLRTYELVTLAAADALRCRYCLLAHGSVLLRTGVELPQLREMITDHRRAGLPEIEVALMDFAHQVALDANQVQLGDIDDLRALGLTDAAILDVTLTATMRSCFSKTFDALGVEPDEAYDDLAVHLADILPPAKALLPWASTVEPGAVAV